MLDPTSTLDWTALYPFTSHTCRLDGQNYHYVDEGQGQPLLMVHGNPTWSFYWRNLATEFRSSFRVVVPDHIGCGLSDKPQRYPYCLRQHIANLVALIEQLDLRHITLLVHDWGGAIGLGAALEVPDRISRLVLFNTGAFPPPFIPWRIRVCRTPLLGTLAVRGLNLFARAALTMATARPDRLTTAVRRGLLAPYDNWSHRVAIDRFVKDIPASPRHPTWATLERIERNLVQLADRPITICWGMRDWCFTEVCLQRFRRIFPHAEVHCFPEAGHYVVEDACERIVPIVRQFLARHPLPVEQPEPPSSR
ncbi:MAG: alpha/beta fold hydrolase [Pirellulaceae bacterium]|nr:alpha/beta fold hydrolase [Pirellulaceae bacterium]